MKTHEPRGIHRLDDTLHTTRRDIGLAATALVVAGVFAFAGGATSAAGNPPPTTTSAAPADEDCGRLWDQIRVLGLPETSWELAATALGLTPRGEWISGDGLTWEHLDGRTVEVAHPRSASPNRVADCATGADADGRSRA